MSRRASRRLQALTRPFSPPSFACLAALAATACGSSADTTGQAPSTSASGLLRAQLHPASEPPALGNQTVELDLTYVDGGAPASGMSLVVVPWMPAMQHGTSIVPTAFETAPGTYTLSNVDLFMPGVWELRTSIDGALDGGAPFADKVAPSLDVP